MRRLLIVGCGDVVRRVLPRLVRRWRVIALVRETEPGLRALGVKQIRGDLDRPETLRRLAGIADAVLHSAPPPNQGTADPRTRRLLAALQRGGSLPPRRLAYIGTSGIYGDCGGDLVAETRAPRPTNARAHRRADAERQLRRFGVRSGCAVSLLRAPGIYAADRLPLDRLHRGDPVLRAEDDVFTNHIQADDLGRACLAALVRGRPNRAYNASDDTCLTMGAWYDTLADAFALARPPRVTRAEAEARLGAASLSFMRESRRLDNSRLKRELGLVLRYPTVHAALAELAAPPAPSA